MHVPLRRIPFGFLEEFPPQCVADDLFIVIQTAYAYSQASSDSRVQSSRRRLSRIDAYSEEFQELPLETPELLVAIPTARRRPSLDAARGGVGIPRAREDVVLRSFRESRSAVDTPAVAPRPPNRSLVHVQ